ncbi:MAG: DUF3105 domain-containing protein [Nitriliruptoraceae bacterium]
MATSNQAKRDRKKQAKAAAQAEKLQAERRARRRSAMRTGGIGLGVVVIAGLVAGGFYLAGSERREARELLGDRVAVEDSLGRDHVSSTTQDPTPTSGPHNGPAICGVQSVPIPADAQIHALEHGAVAFQYLPDALDGAELAGLHELAERYETDVLVAPNPALDSPVVATAWTRRMALDSADLDLLETFATAFRGKGPENVDCHT